MLAECLGAQRVPLGAQIEKFGRPVTKRDGVGEGPPAEKLSVSGPCREVQAPIGRPAFRPCVGSGRGGRPRPFRDAAKGAFCPDRFHPRASQSPENGAAALPGPGRRLPRAFGHFRYPGLCGIALPSGPPSRCPAFPAARHATGSTTRLVGKPGPFLRMSAGRPQDVLNRPPGRAQRLPLPPPASTGDLRRPVFAQGLSKGRLGDLLSVPRADGVAKVGARFPHPSPRRAPSLGRRA